MNVADVLRGAAEEIDKRGLHKGEIFSEHAGYVEARANPDVKCCALGAIDLVSDYPTSSDLANGAETFFRYYIADAGLTGIGTWNDAPERTQNEVVTTLRAAADQWEADNGVA